MVSLITIIAIIAFAALIYSQIQSHARITALEIAIKSHKREIKLIRALLDGEEVDLREETIPSGIMQAEKAVFDSSGLMQTILCTLIHAFEIHGTTSVLDSREEKGYFIFLRHNVPVSSLCFFSIAYVLGWVAYFHLISPVTFFNWFAKAFIIWNLSILFANIITNMIRLYRYLPSSWDSWSTKLKDRAWWWWLFSRSLSIDSVDNAISLGVFIATRLFLIWPFRYFFYHCQHCASPALHDFLVNMLLHCVAITLWSFLSYMGALGTITSLNKRLLRINPDIDIVFACVFCGGNILLSVLRLVWLFFYGECTWWGSLVVAPLFTIAQFGMVFISVPVLFASNFKKTYFQAFREKLGTEETQEQLRREESTEAAAEDVFIRLLDTTTRVYMFGYREAQDKEQEDKTLYERAFQQVVFAAEEQRRAAEEQAEKEDETAAPSSSSSSKRQKTEEETMNTEDDLDLPSNNKSKDE